MKRVHVTVAGMVQGVFFRDSCRREAQRRGVAGWVRNSSTGDVEAEFEGDEAEVDALVAWCRQGPPAAEVAGVEVVEVAPTGATRFEVR